MAEWLAPASKHRVTCLDIGSLADAETRLLAANVALRQVWDQAMQEWVAAISRPADKDERGPIFVVIDEAHNLAATSPTTTLARETNEILVRMATEGRKFGIFLILVTQRPSRLDPSLLSQCDNRWLLKMNNYVDLQLVEQGFGFLRPGMVQRALEFKVGQALLAGNFVAAPTYAQVAPRRTAEGGRNLEVEFWGQDPITSV